MTAGRPAKPNELKRLLGVPGNRPLPDLASITNLPMAKEIPPAPEGLGPIGTKLWDRSWGMFITWLSPVSDIEAIENAARLADVAEAARVKYMATLESADARAYVAINKAYTEALTSLGFDPVARSRLGVAEVRAVTAIDRLLEKRQNRATIILEETGDIVSDETSSD